MKNLFVWGTLCLGFWATAQEIDAARKAIDAEQFEKAKQLLKQCIQTKPTQGKAYYLLGTIYMRQEYLDSARTVLQRGQSVSENARFNTIGLGQLDLLQGQTAAAQQKFESVLKELKKKDVEEYICMARSYMSQDKPDYVTALTYLEKGKLANPNDAQLNLAFGDAYYGEKKQNEAYVAYRNAFQFDSSLLRAKMQLGVLLKGARAFTEAINAYNEVIGINPNYGPVYRELAETYYLWANNDPKKYNDYIKQALDFYTKYMSLTDYSVNSRMRHADFLILAKDYKTLEEEANQIKALDKINPRIYRYLGYAAYENGNYDGAVTALTTFVNAGTNKIIPRDYYYLGLSRLRKCLSAETKTADQAQLDLAIADMKKALDMEPLLAVELNDIGKKVYEMKIFNAAAAVFELAVSNPNQKNYLIDNFYLGNAIYYYNTRKEMTKPDAVMLQKADAAFENVINGSPNAQDAYLFRARTNRLLENDEKMAEFYQKYVEVITAKGPEEMAKSKAKIIEAYNNIAAHWANTDKVKAIDYFNKTLALDPANDYASKSIKVLKP